MQVSTWSTVLVMALALYTGPTIGSEGDEYIKMDSAKRLNNENNCDIQNNTAYRLLEEIHQAVNENKKKMAELEEMLEIIQTSNISINTKKTASEIASELRDDGICLCSGTQEPSSCSDIKPNKPNGHYRIHNRTVYCKMDKLCGKEGGWTRLAHLNMTETTANCPSGFRQIKIRGARACGRPTSYKGSCVSVRFPSHGISYSEVCGRVVGYQYGSPDAADTRYISTTTHNDINSFYVDGVSITRGNPRRHVWTLMASNNDQWAKCPCSTPPGSTQNVQAFVGNDYFCESGDLNDPLWDGEGCGSQEAKCCAASGLPWFHKALSTTTTDYLELRVCGDQRTSDEDAPVGFYEIYVK